MAIKPDIEKIRRLVGPATAEQLRYVDCFVSDDVGLFIPVGGACLYARTPRHNHPGYMFVLSFDDSTSLRLNSESFLAQPGKVFALAPFIPHEEVGSDLPPRYIAVLIDPEFFREQLACYPATVDPDLLLSGCFIDCPPGLLPLLKRFMAEAEASMPGMATVLHGLSLEICHLLIRAIFAITSSDERVATRLEIDRVVQHLHADPAKKITVEEMARWACMSPSHFTRTFQRELGVAPSAYLLQIRLKLAKKLLAAGEKTITEIALDCGFGSVSYLSSCFRSQFKMSPSEFRKQLNKAE